MLVLKPGIIVALGTRFRSTGDFPTFNDTTWASLTIGCRFEPRADAWWLVWMEWKRGIDFLSCGCCGYDGGLRVRLVLDIDGSN